MHLVGDVVPQHTIPKLKNFGDGVVLANLEGPVCSDGLPPVDKVGQHLHSMPFDIPANWAFSLANNHIMDYGEKGLSESFRFLQSKGCKFAGAGNSEKEARSPMWLSESGKRIAVFSCCERQFCVALKDMPGVAEKGLWLLSAIRKAKTDGADFVVVSCHAGSEFSPFVNPRLRAFYHILVDAGADVIHGHHSHVPQGWESYRGRPIFYGLGNYVVDRQDWLGNPHYGWSITVDVDFHGNVPTWTVSFSGELPTDHRDYIHAINSGFDEPLLLEALWQETAVRLYTWLYEQNLRAASVIRHRLTLRDRLRKLYFVLGDIKRILTGRELPTCKSKFYAKVLYNFINCESHSNAISTAIGVMCGVEKDLRSERSCRYVDKFLIGK